jgi:hypothetical protein
MAIKSVKEIQRGKIKIDLTGPEGNAFVLLGKAGNLSKQLGKDFEDIKKRMTSGDYENLINVFDEEFGDYVDLYR